MDHIIVACSITRQIWFQAAAALNQGAPTASGVLIEWWHTWRSQWTGDWRKGADSLSAPHRQGNLEGEERSMLPRSRN